MSASNRNLGRLPLSIFENLKYIIEGKEEESSSSSLRKSIATKLSGGSKEVTTVASFLGLSLSLLVRLLDPLLTYDECQELRLRICHLCSPKPVSALSLLQKSHHSSTGIPSLDACLGGQGLLGGTISELVGKPGAGKTQLAMQLCVVAALRGFGSIYIDTEKKLSVERLAEIAAGRGSPAETVLSNVRVIQSANSTVELVALIESLEEQILNQEAVRLVVVDSIAAPTRNSAESAPQRALHLMSMAQSLKTLADQLDLTIVVVNQVDGTRAALGTSWHHCLSTRIFMEQLLDGSARKATIVKSNIVASTSMIYEITTQGLVALTTVGYE